MTEEEAKEEPPTAVEDTVLEELSRELAELNQRIAEHLGRRPE
ncbi:hypothetical protein [Streptomyces johnsoniae]|uniref:Uncharacterized protein n=1 Tax=Streptomyces johnsoniae TaxID=3075532 RepID=A0ABU2RX10_9ACTN|nr:hypothetical protein [Streptomyces sp. DSM 41886]MDT0441272.1 hypothetical protein [Streptomyces sp. DSM 41886]